MNPTIRTLHEAAQEIAAWLEWELGSLEDFHAYGQKFGSAGNNVYTLVLLDALKYRSMTLDQLRGK